jgi:hypothetical protein
VSGVQVGTAFLLRPEVTTAAEELAALWLKGGRYISAHADSRFGQDDRAAERRVAPVLGGPLPRRVLVDGHLLERLGRPQCVRR